MDTTTPQPTEPQAPVTADAELKMPEEEFGGPRPPSDAPSILIPLLAGLLIALLVALAVLFIFRDTLMELIGMDSGTADVLTETEPEPTEPEVKDTAELDQLQSELEATTFAEIEADLAEIDAEFADAATTTVE